MYKLTMINRNGYTIERNFKTIAQCKSFASFYPLKAFFCWIYDTKKGEMKAQNVYKESWKRCNNDTFISYF